MKLISQYLDVGLSVALIIALWKLRLQVKYLPISIFLLVDSLESLLYIGARWLVEHRMISLDYRLFWCPMTWIEWITTIWMVYALLIAILKQLPGILRFSLRLMAVVVALSFVIAILTIGPEYAASGGNSASLLARTYALTQLGDRALSMAELLAILSILAFVLRFPIRVPRNLAAFCVGLSCYLFLRISFFLLRTYVPSFQASENFNSLPGYLMGACLIYWVFSVDAAGEQAQVTLGRGWQSVPKEHLVRQLEGMNAALLRSREQA